MADYVLSPNEDFETVEEQEEVNIQHLLPQSQQYERILVEEVMQNISNNNFETHEQEYMFPGASGTSF